MIACDQHLRVFHGPTPDSYVGGQGLGFFGKAVPWIPLSGGAELVRGVVERLRQRVTKLDPVS